MHDTPVERPWGSYLVIDESDTHKTKRIVVYPGARLSYQRHRYRAEHWFVVSGTADITVDDERRMLDAGESVDIARGMAHRVANGGSTELVFVEVQTGDYFGEDDIERLEDDYGRTGVNPEMVPRSRTLG